jgi:hypothetical protein
VTDERKERRKGKKEILVIFLLAIVCSMFYINYVKWRRKGKKQI